MRLIVRVCDYDWGKRDDNIGEIVIDANKLVSRNDAVTFNLTRNGKPEQGTVTLAGHFVPTSTLSLDYDEKNAYTVASKETLVLKVIKGNGLRKADWFGQNDGEIKTTIFNLKKFIYAFIISH